ncbi:hypothetical protein [Streptomyces buecherae]|uniref:hypothetical protein n=1 Tax=Streptomyces buecherae TaxID=2763006 RepID=UPI0036A8E8BF
MRHLIPRLNLHTAYGRFTVAVLTSSLIGAGTLWAVARPPSDNKEVATATKPLATRAPSHLPPDDTTQRERAVQLAKRSLTLHEENKELDNEELAEFHTLLRDNAKDPEFAAAFYHEMGAKDALRFQAQLSIDASSGDDKTRLELAQSIQKDMGLALATATDPSTGDDAPRTILRAGRTYLGKTWVDELKTVGTQPLRLGLDHAQPVGYQALASLLQNGTYDKSFLNPIAQAVVTLERKGASWPIPDPHRGSQHFGLNLTHKNTPGWDPMTGLLEAFGRSPEASTAFFNGSTGGGKSGLKLRGNLEFLTTEDNGREWLPDRTSGLTNPDEESRWPAKQALGHALESATTGRPYGDDGALRPHTREQADVFEKAVKEFGSHPDSIKHDGSLATLAPSLGNMSAEYMYDIQREFMGGSGADSYFRHAGAGANLSYKEGDALEAFLQAVAENPRAYGTVIAAQQTVTTAAIRGAIADADGRTLAGEAERAAMPGARVADCATEGQFDAIAAAGNGLQTITEYNDSLAVTDKWVGRLTAMAAIRPPATRNAASRLSAAVRAAAMRYYEEDGPAELEEVEEGKRNYVLVKRSRIARAASQAVLAAAQQEGIPAGPRTPAAGAVADVYMTVNSTLWGSVQSS